MKKSYEEINREILALISLNRYPVSYEHLLGIMRQASAKNHFKALNSLNYPQYLRPRYVQEMLEDKVAFNEVSRTFCLKSKLESDVLSLETLQDAPELAKVVSSEISRMSMPESQGVLRDIRNSIYTSDLQLFGECLKDVNFIVSQNPCAFSHPGELFAFMENTGHLDWVGKLPPELLNILCANYIPYAIFRLGNVGALADAATAIQDKLTMNALVALTDFRLLSGDAGAAAKLIPLLDESLRLPRNAFLAFAKHRIDSALGLFEEFLVQADAEKYKEFFSSQFGLSFIFSLISSCDYAKALEMSERGVSVGKLKVAYGRLAEFIRHCSGISEEKPQSDESGTGEIGTLMEQFVVQVCNFAEHQEKQDDLPMLLRLASATAGGYSILEDDCRLMNNYVGRTHSSDDCFNEAPLFLNCLHTRPLWERDVDSLLAIAETKATTERLVWLCRDNPAAKCRVFMYPYEQKMSKSGNWSSGARFPILNTVESNIWPQFLTLQDQMMCKIIAEEARAKGLTTLDSIGVASPTALEAAAGHPELYWLRDNKRVKFSCRKVKPVIRVNCVDGQVCLSMETNSDDSIVAMVDNNDDVAVCHYSEQQSRVAEALSSGLRVPAECAEKLHRLLATLAWNFNIVSDQPLDFVEIQTCVCESEFHLRLRPAEERMWVDLLVSPFNGINGLERPGEGSREIICIKDGVPTRFVRDFEKELSKAEEIVSECAIISDDYENGHWTWELMSLEQCYDFVFSLRGLFGKVCVHWPDNKKIKVSRRLDFMDVKFNCKKKNDWFYSIDGNVTMEDGTAISLIELIEAAMQKNGNFIRLKDGQILALAESFRKKLEDISAVSRFSGNGIVVSRAASMFLADVIGEAGCACISEAIEAFDKAQGLVPELPKGLRAKLRPYQVEGYKWLCGLDAWGAGACLADDMGLGKTLQTIAFILSKADEGPSLVVAPTSVCNNWMRELERFAPSLNAILFGGLKRKELFEAIGPRCVMVCSYGLMQSEEDTFRTVNWRIAVLDEAQAIKNYNTKRAKAVVELNAKCRIVTTGTPIENNLNELWSIFNFINPGLLGDHSEFQDRFVVPIEELKKKEAMERLSSILKPFVLRRLKKNVLKDLPPKTEIQQFVNLSDVEREFYNDYRLKLLSEISSADLTPGQQRMKVIAAITKLRLAACNAKLILPEIEVPSSKMEAFCELLEQLLAEKHKILVFSQYVKHLTLVRHVLEGMGIGYQYMDGEMSAAERDVAVSNFQNSDSDFVFLISLKTGGMGLNLTAADYVIHLDPWWNPAVEDQASDRAHRIGQTRHVTIYHIIAKGTIEEKIIELHQNKRELAENILAGKDSVNKITREELLRLLQP